MRSFLLVAVIFAASFASAQTQRVINLNLDSFMTALKKRLINKPFPAFSAKNDEQAITNEKPERKSGAGKFLVRRLPSLYGGNGHAE